MLEQAASRQNAATRHALDNNVLENEAPDKNSPGTNALDNNIDDPVLHDDDLFWLPAVKISDYPGRSQRGGAGLILGGVARQGYGVAKLAIDLDADFDAAFG